MSNVVQLNATARSRAALIEKACLWIVRLSAGASARELDELHAWLDESPAHITVLLEVASLWDQVSVLSELSDVFPLQQYLESRPRTSARRLKYAVVVACVLLLGLLVPLRGWVEAARSAFRQDSLQLSYETRIGQQFTVVLPDGSEVLLNTNSRIDIAFSAASRVIVLERGEGQFKVAKNPERPFRVYANGGMVEAVGTAFTVQQLHQQSLEVMVLEGEVSFTRTLPAMPSVSAAEAPQASSTPSTPQAQAVPAAPVRTAAASTRPISLVAGEAVQVNDSDAAVKKQTVEPAELESRLAWRDGMLLFQGDRLESVIGEISRYTAIRIDVDEAARDIEVLGVYRTVDIEGVLEAMSVTFNLRVERISDDHIVLKAANQEATF